MQSNNMKYANNDLLRSRSKLHTSMPPIIDMHNSDSSIDVWHGNLVLFII